MRLAPPLLLVFAAACVAEPGGTTLPINDSGTPGDGSTSTEQDAGTISGNGPFCEVVAQVFVPQCTVCHKPGGNPPDLTFAGAQRELVGISSPMFPATPRVVAGNREGSLLWRKVAGNTQAADGTPMPTGTTGLPANLLALVGAWIDAGAPTNCDNLPMTDGGNGRYHPADYAQSAVHGLELKLQTQDCRTCHGNTLEGAAGPSCDGCHQQDWRTTCTYCHGGTDTMTGAPPRELRGTTARDQLVFRAHTEHTTERNHTAWDCTQCHTKPTDVLTMDHVFDSTPGASEVVFSGGLSPSGTYAAGECSNLYCHGNGRTAQGRIEHTAARPSCDGCHPSITSTTRWLQMSGEHRVHLRDRVTCGECHAGTSDLGGTSIVNVANHVNGTKDIMFTAANFTRTASGCNGTCHGERHLNRRW
jgi:predicted CxxxxCH...CXXCH cytochrome family protein